MNRTHLRTPLISCSLAVCALLSFAQMAVAHPMGNFSVSHFASIRIERGYVEVRYLIDMAEIPTYQEIQRTGIVAEGGNPSLASYLAEEEISLGRGLLLEIDGKQMELRAIDQNALFTPGAGGLPTMRLGFLYRAAFGKSFVQPGPSRSLRRQQLRRAFRLEGGHRHRWRRHLTGQQFGAVYGPECAVVKLSDGFVEQSAARSGSDRRVFDVAFGRDPESSFPCHITFVGAAGGLRSKHHLRNPLHLCSSRPGSATASRNKRGCRPGGRCNPGAKAVPSVKPRLQIRPFSCKRMNKKHHEANSPN